MGWTDQQRRALERMTATRSRRDEVYADVANDRDLTAEERDERIRAVVRAAWKILATRPDWARVIEPEPPAPDFPEVWARLVARRRANG
ncbi:MAG: hypothetical protein H6738_21720 [Alphaproteobacteria bacterium]|nr:hypothetical protein [Myxococcales bacterium]MCB9689748.1 hypothetical protein [Alphaproteobacteria bacterium]MCB9699416.1 hypothetical protein [Alphaproteobacteria bacterium]